MSLRFSISPKRRMQTAHSTVWSSTVPHPLERADARLALQARP